MILAGDIGGTKTLLEVGSFADGQWRPTFRVRYTSSDYLNLHILLQRFFRDWNAIRTPHEALTHACLGVAGPVSDNRVVMTNLPWIADANAISAEFCIPNVRIVNDFFAAASGIENLCGEDLVVLQTGEAVHAAPRLIIGAGTGFGVAQLIPMGAGYEVIAGEGGHVAFAPTTLDQLELWRDIYLRHGRVNVEDVVSGRGLVCIYKFLVRTVLRRSAQDDVSPAAIVRAALDCGDPLSLRAVDLFIECYAGTARNFALAMLARGGVVISGGIAPKIMSRLSAGGFLAAFNGSDTHSQILGRMPVSVVTNERLVVLGSALIGTRLWSESMKCV